MRRVQLIGTVLLLLLILGLSASAVLSNPYPQEPPPPTMTAVPPPEGPGPPQPVIRRSIKNDTSPPLRSIAPLAPRVEELREIPMHPLPRGEGVRPSEAERAGRDPVLQDWHGEASMPAPIQDFEGVSNVNNVLPPDTEGDVGPNHYVQWVNLSGAIWDKSGNLLYGPVNGNTLWSGFGGLCETTNNGDPIVLYDHLADRWLVSQFAFAFDILNNPKGPFHQCIAISQTGDPTGGWYRYDFVISASKLNDYPKFGVWPDGYYMAVNQFQKVFFFGWVWAGQGVVAFERDEMLAGKPAQMVYFDLYSVDPNLGGMLPSDLDGPTPPPPGSPNYFVQFDDNAWGYSPDQLQIWQFDVDWTTPANSTFTGPTTLATAPFDSYVCSDYARNCIPQPITLQGVDAISDRLMYRLQYRNFGTHETLVVNHTVDVGGDHAGIRWYEVRDPGGTPTIYQQGTYAPADDDHRWMGSIAMDGAGNMALGYSVSSSTTYPSIRYVGRLASDPLGTMPQGETELIGGSGYQTHSAARWGDYSTMSVDPTDDCTFWYTQEYYATIGTGNAPWQTRIGSFKFPTCGTGTLEGTVTDPDTLLPIADAYVDADGYSTLTNPSGFYQFPDLPVGTYDVTASASGYMPSTASGVSVADGGTTTQDFALTPLPYSIYFPLVRKNY